MDPLSDILTLLRPTDYGFRGLDAGGRWSLSFAPADGLRCFAIETGSVWLDGPVAKTLLSAGDVVLLAAGARLRLYSHPDADPIDAYAFFSSFPLGGLATLNGGGGCRGVGGFFAFDRSGARAFLDAVPPLVHVRSQTGKAALVGAIAQLVRELAHPQPGSALLASHLAQAMLIEALRAYLNDAPKRSGWLAALADPSLRGAMSAMHEDPARRWTVGELAKRAGMSRSTFAERFRASTGGTPIDYLTRWRMTIAAERLGRPGETLTAVSRSVGYESESAFGAAFKRVTGLSPRSIGRGRL